MTLHDTTDTDPIQRRFDEWRATYSGRRTVTAQMLDEAATLIRTAIAAEQRANQRALQQQRVDHEREVTRLNDRLQQALRDAGEARRIRSEAEALVAEKVRLREEREQTGEEVTVKIQRHLGGWVLSDLEEIAYRLRCGGAVDDTALIWREHTITANVPAPNLVPLQRLDDQRAERLTENRVVDPSDIYQPPDKGWGPIRLGSVGLGFWVTGLFALGAAAAQWWPW